MKTEPLTLDQLIEQLKKIREKETGRAEVVVLGAYASEGPVFGVGWDGRRVTLSSDIMSG